MGTESICEILNKSVIFDGHGRYKSTMELMRDFRNTRVWDSLYISLELQKIYERFRDRAWKE